MTIFQIVDSMNLLLFIARPLKTRQADEGVGWGGCRELQES